LLGHDLGLASSLRPGPVPTLAVVGPDLGCGINTFADIATVCWGCAKDSKKLELEKIYR